MIVTRLQEDRDIPRIVELYNRIVAEGGYAKSTREFNRMITEQDWRDFEKVYDHAVRLVFEKDGTWYGFSALRDGDRGRIIHEHLGVFNADGPESEIMWQIVEYVRDNTKFEVMLMDRSELTNVEHFDALARELGATLGEDNVWRKTLADARRPPADPVPVPRKTISLENAITPPGFPFGEQ